MRTRKGFTLIELMIVIAIIAVIAAIAIPNLMRSKMESNAVSAIAGLRTISTAQNTWHRNDHDLNNILDFTPFYRNLHYTLDMAARKVGYIDKPLADASGVAGLDKNGYRYGDMVLHFQTGVFNYRYEYGLSAWPATYGRSGTNSYITNAEGTIFQRDLGLASTLIPTYPDTSFGWIIVH